MGFEMNTTGDLVPIREAAKRRFFLIPANVAGIRAWISRGVLSRRGERVRLHATKVGGKYFVREADCQAFCEALNAEPAAV